MDFISGYLEQLQHEVDTNTNIETIKSQWPAIMEDSLIDKVIQERLDSDRFLVRIPRVIVKKATSDPNNEKESLEKETFALIDLVARLTCISSEGDNPKEKKSKTGGFGGFGQKKNYNVEKQLFNTTDNFDQRTKVIGAQDDCSTAVLYEEQIENRAHYASRISSDTRTKDYPKPDDFFHNIKMLTPIRSYALPANAATAGDPEDGLSVFDFNPGYDRIHYRSTPDSNISLQHRQKIADRHRLKRSTKLASVVSKRSKKKGVILPVKLWIRIPLSKATGKLLRKCKRQLEDNCFRDKFKVKNGKAGKIGGHSMPSQSCWQTIVSLFLTPKVNIRDCLLNQKESPVKSGPQNKDKDVLVTCPQQIKCSKLTSSSQEETSIYNSKNELSSLIVSFREYKENQKRLKISHNENNVLYLGKQCPQISQSVPNVTYLGKQCPTATKDVANHTSLSCTDSCDDEDDDEVDNQSTSTSISEDISPTEESIIEDNMHSSSISEIISTSVIKSPSEDLTDFLLRRDAILNGELDNENKLSKTSASPTALNEGTGQINEETNALDLPCILDDRDCLSIFDEFDVNIDDDLFSKETSENKLNKKTFDRKSIPERAENRIVGTVSSNFGIGSPSKKPAIEIKTRTVFSNVGMGLPTPLLLETRSDTGPVNIGMGLLPTPVSIETRLGTGTQSQNNNEDSEVFLRQTTDIVSSTEVDAQTTMPKNLLVPPGFCYKYLSTSKCQYGNRCKFKHDSPSQEQIVNHCLEKVAVMISNKDYIKALCVYRGLCESAPCTPLPCHLLYPLLLGGLGLHGMPDSLYLLNMATQTNLLNSEICNGMIRLFWPQRDQFDLDLEKMIIAVISLDISLDPDCKIIVLLFSSLTGRATLLWELLCVPGPSCLTVPVMCVHTALQHAITHPHPHVLARCGKWLRDLHPCSLSHTPSEVASPLVAGLQDVMPEAVDWLLTALSASICFENQVGPILPMEVLPVEDLEPEDLEEYKFYFHRILGCGSSNNWAYLGTMFLELCEKLDLANAHFLPAYLCALRKNKSAEEVAAGVTSFVDTVISEQTMNVFVEQDLAALSTIVSSTMFCLAHDEEWGAALAVLRLILYRPLTLVTEVTPELTDLSDLELLGQSLPCVALRIVVETKEYLMAVTLVENNRSAFIDLESSSDIDLVTFCLQSLHSDLQKSQGSQISLTLTKLIRMILEESDAVVKQILIKGPKEIFENLIRSFLTSGDLTSIQKVIQCLQLTSEATMVTGLTMRRFLSGSVDTGMVLGEDMLTYCWRHVDYPVQPQISTKYVHIQLGMTEGELRLAISQCLDRLFEYLCTKVQQGAALEHSDLLVNIKMLPGFIQPLDVAYLGSAPRDMDTLTKATLRTLTCFTPPLEGYHVSVVGGATIGGVAMSHSIVVLNSSLAVYIQHKDVQDGHPRLSRQLQNLLKSTLPKS